MDCEAALRKEPRVVWTEAETLYLLKVFKEHNVVELLEGKKYRQNGIFEIVHDKMVEAGKCIKACACVQKLKQF